MSWKDEIKKKDKPIYQQPDKMQFVGRLENLPRMRGDVFAASNQFIRLLNKGRKRQNGLRMHEAEQLLKYAEQINEGAPKLLEWIKSELKKHE